MIIIAYTFIFAVSYLFIGTLYTNIKLVYFCLKIKKKISNIKDTKEYKKIKYTFTVSDGECLITEEEILQKSSNRIISNILGHDATYPLNLDEDNNKYMLMACVIWWPVVIIFDIIKILSGFFMYLISKIFQSITNIILDK